jgi:hypothetical protein
MLSIVKVHLCRPRGVDKEKSKHALLARETFTLPVLHFLRQFYAVADIMSEVIQEKEAPATEASTPPALPATDLESESELVNASGHVQEVDRK